MRIASLLLLVACSGQGPAASNEDAGVVVDEDPMATPSALSRTPVPQAVPFPEMGPGEAAWICEDDSDESACDSCQPGYRCAAAFCGGEECVPGAPCGDDDDCAGHCVRPSDAPPSERGLCVVGDSPCSNDRECSHGFRCESGACVDRRIPCGFHERGCPRRHLCTFMPVEGHLFCVPAQVPCEGDAQCEVGAQCVDVDGDGSTECVPAGACTSNADCGEGRSCGVDPGTSQSACVVDGACRDGSCSDGFVCLDTGSGHASCVRPGSCRRDAECPPQSICGAISPGDPLRCLTFDEGER